MKPIIVRNEQPWGWSHAVEPRFQPLVARLEAMAAASPGPYRRRVMGAALLGYGFLALLLTVMLLGFVTMLVLLVRGTGGGGALIKLMIVLAVPAWLIIRALLVRVDPPSGQALAPADAPALFALIERVRMRTGGPGLHAVLITPDFNAAIVQHPRFCAFGGHRNYLLIGLPLMQALDAAALEAVVAHEFGHLANADGKLSTWIYRVRATWARLSESLEHGGTGALPARFFRWYGPWFNAYSFVLARQMEYAADRASADATSRDTAGRALATVMVEAARYDQEHWSAVLADDNKRAASPALPFTAAARFFADSRSDRAALLRRALRGRTDLTDTHPCLADRLAALGVEPAVPAPLQRSAAEALLPDGGHALAADYDRQWWAYHAESWAADTQWLANAEADLAERDAAAADGSLAPEAALGRAALTERLRGAEAAEPLYRAIAEDRAGGDDAASARFAVARLQLRRGDADGLDALERLVAEAPAFKPDAAGEALYFLSDAPDHDPRRAVWQQMLDADWARQDRLAAETSRIDPEVDFEPAVLDAALRHAIAEAAATDRRVSRLYAVQRRLDNGPPSHQLVMLFVASDGYMERPFDPLMDAVLHAAEPSGMATLIVRHNSSNRWFRKRLERMADALVFDSKMMR